MSTPSSGPREFSNSVQAWSHLKKKAVATKAQDRREKFAMDIELIRSRKQNESIITTPVPSDQQEGYFAKLESNGVWRQLFQSMTNLSDITSAYFADGMFHDELEEKRISMLLPQVFRVLRNPSNNDDVEDDDERYGNILNRKDVVNIRLASRTWNMAAVTQFLEPVGFSEPDWHLRRDRDNVSGKMLINNEFLPVFKNTNGVELAITALRTSRFCPSLLKILEISSGYGMSSEEKDTFISKLGELLDAHGEHVWGLHFDGPFDYKALWTLVSRTPNLKELAVCCWKIQGEYLNGNHERMLLAHFPFPAMASLTRLIFPLDPTSIIWVPEIVVKSPNLKTVAIAGFNPNILLGHLFPALANLRLECLQICLGDKDRMSLNDIRPLGQMQWPLKVFNLSWFNEEEDGFSRRVDSWDLFRILSQFNDTLEVIHVRTMVPTDSGKKVFVHFPKLKHLDIGWVKVLFKAL